MNRILLGFYTTSFQQYSLNGIVSNEKKISIRDIYGSKDPTTTKNQQENSTVEENNDSKNNNAHFLKQDSTPSTTQKQATDPLSNALSDYINRTNIQTTQNRAESQSLPTYCEDHLLYFNCGQNYRYKYDPDDHKDPDVHQELESMVQPLYIAPTSLYPVDMPIEYDLDSDTVKRPKWTTNQLVGSDCEVQRSSPVKSKGTPSIAAFMTVSKDKNNEQTNTIRTVQTSPIQHPVQVMDPQERIISLSLSPQESPIVQYTYQLPL